LLLRRSAIVLLIPALGVVAPRPATGQLAVEVAAGVRYSTVLVRDSIVTPFAVRPAVAPTLAITLATPLGGNWGAHVTLDFSTSEIRRHDADGSSAALGRVSTAALTVGLERQLAARFSARVGVGGLTYIPSEKIGIFRLGGGSIAGLGALAIGHALPVSTRFGFVVEARYDVHGFTTPALRDEGFTSARTMHRVALTVRARGLRTR